MILVIAEQQEGTLNRASWETIAAAQQAGGPVTVAVLGAGAHAAAAELAAGDVAEVLVVQAPALDRYTLDGYVAALMQLISAEHPDDVFLPHTYQTRDYAPALAVRLGRALITDCVGTKRSDTGRLFVRPLFQGRLLADVAPAGPARSSPSRSVPCGPIRPCEAPRPPRSGRSRRRSTRRRSARHPRLLFVRPSRPST
jgi:electron transfer flavoprotein alpha subunit